MGRVSKPSYKVFYSVVGTRRSTSNGAVGGQPTLLHTGHDTGERASLMPVASLLPAVRGFDVDDVQEPAADKEGKQGVDDGVR